MLATALAAISVGGVPSAGALTLSPPRLELESDPGRTIIDQLDLFNEEGETRTFYSSFANFEAKGETGVPHFTGGDTGLATWITTEPSVTLAPGERKKVPYRIEIPADAPPGGYFAAIFWGTAPPAVEAGGQVAIGGSVGTLVLLTVAGAQERGAGILEFSIDEKRRVVSGLPIVFSFRFANDGADRVKPEGELVIKNMFGSTVATMNANPGDGNVLPNSVRKFQLVWAEKNQDKFLNPPLPREEEKPGFMGTARNQLGNFALGLYQAELDLVYGDERTPASAGFRFFVVPWQLLSMVFGAIGFAGLFLWFVARRYNRWVARRAMAQFEAMNAGEPARKTSPGTTATKRPAKKPRIRK